MNKAFLILISALVSISAANLISGSDISVWQGQYYTGTTFNTGNFEFNFSVYDNSTGGNICYSNATTLTTGVFGEWRTEQKGVGHLCDDSLKNYYLEIKINNIVFSNKR